MTDEIRKLRRITKLLRKHGVKYYSTQNLTLELFEKEPDKKDETKVFHTPSAQLQAHLKAMREAQLNPDVDEVDVMIASMASSR
jgi:hypothetical protein